MTSFLRRDGEMTDSPPPEELPDGLVEIGTTRYVSSQRAVDDDAQTRMS